MNQLLANKMDALEQWGVLVPPETVGVQVKFVSPSMLIRKPDSSDYRLVTDFASLNVYIKRVPMFGPDIQLSFSVPRIRLNELILNGSSSI